MTKHLDLSGVQRYNTNRCSNEPLLRPQFTNLDLSDSVGQLGSCLSAILAELLIQVAELDRREANYDDGAPSMESWLCTRLGLSYGTALEYVRVARALTSLPCCAQAMAEGRLSWDQVRALTRFATPAQDAALTAQAEGMSTAALEWAARQARRVSRAEAREEHDRRGLRWWFPHQGGFRLSARMPAAEGAVVAAALERVVDQLPPQRSDHDGVFETASAQYADALYTLASTSIAQDADADRACVVVHDVAGALAGGPGGAQLEDGSALSLDVARRLACDCRLQLVAEGESGPIGVGRTPAHDPTLADAPAPAPRSHLHVPRLRPPALARRPPPPALGRRRPHRPREPALDLSLTPTSA